MCYVLCSEICHVMNRVMSHVSGYVLFYLLCHVISYNMLCYVSYEVSSDLQIKIWQACRQPDGHTQVGIEMLRI